jgi:hypothetical protein
VAACLDGEIAHFAQSALPIIEANPADASRSTNHERGASWNMRYRSVHGSIDASTRQFMTCA